MNGVVRRHYWSCESSDVIVGGIPLCCTRRRPDVIPPHVVCSCFLNQGILTSRWVWQRRLKRSLSTKSTKKEVTLPFGSIVWPSFTGAALLVALEMKMTLQSKVGRSQIYYIWDGSVIIYDKTILSYNKWLPPWAIDVACLKTVWQSASIFWKDSKIHCSFSPLTHLPSCVVAVVPHHRS
jgi:hypothetical protein